VKKFGPIVLIALLCGLVTEVGYCEKVIPCSQVGARLIYVYSGPYEKCERPDPKGPVHVLSLHADPKDVKLPLRTSICIPCLEDGRKKYFYAVKIPNSPANVLGVELVFRGFAGGRLEFFDECPCGDK
jgi:hypothetical protein